MYTSYPMTKRGEAKLKAELEFLKFDKRPKITAAIAEARGHGDLKENAEYHAAREDQGFCEARIKDIEAKLSGSQVIDLNIIEEREKVIFGTKVTIYNTQTEEEVVYRLVGDDESNPNSGRISVMTPIAKGLIGKEIGDVTKITTPAGIVEFEIIDIDYTPEDIDAE